MKQVISFLRELVSHNNREWFAAHKAEYEQARQTVEKLAEELILRIGEFDTTIKNLKPADCTYRIYRDLRFSQDKSPFKDHMGIYICRGGKKSGFSGYYFHISANQSDEDPTIKNYDACHMMAIGNYYCDPKVLRVLREDIELGEGDFECMLEKVTTAHAYPQLKLDYTDALKNVPRDFPKDSPHAQFLKLKNYALYASLSDEYLTAPHLAERLAEVCRTAKPFLDFVNRGIEFAMDED